jgi:hypothetical protein
MKDYSFALKCQWIIEAMFRFPEESGEWHDLGQSYTEKTADLLSAVFFQYLLSSSVNE